jgi:MFS family permease
MSGLLTLVSWRLIFFINVPVGAAALLLATRVGRSPHRRVPFDWFGQVTAVLAMGALTYGAIEAGADGFTAPRVLLAFGLAVVALGAFLAAQRRVDHPMVPPDLFRSRNVRVSVAVGFAFVVGYYGLPFVMSLYLQQLRGLSSFATGVAFLPMMLAGAALTRSAPGAVLVTSGLMAMTTGLAILAVAPSTTPVWVLSGLMVLVGLAGPLVSPPVTAILLNSVPDHQAGTASGVFNTSRQMGGALAVAVFGAMLAKHGAFMPGLRTSLLIAAAVALVTAAASLRLRPPTRALAADDQWPAASVEPGTVTVPANTAVLEGVGSR